MNYVKTTTQLVSENYPYGFRLRTTKTDYLEFDRKKGFRHCSYTIDPRNGQVNKPKKSTYSEVMVMGKDDNNYTKVIAFEFYNEKGTNRLIEFLSNEENFALFTAEQIEYIYIRLIAYIKTTIYAQVQYCNAKFDDLKPLFDPAIELAVKGAKEKGVNNYFSQISFDWEKIDACKEEGYQPFRLTSIGS